MNEFKFRPDTTTNSRVICPCASEKMMYNAVNTLAPLFLIGSSSYWQVMRTSTTSRTSSQFGQIGPRTAELAVLEGHLQRIFKYIVVVFCMPVKHLQAIIMLKSASENFN